MKRIFNICALVFGAALLFASCNKDVNGDQNKTEDENEELVIPQTMFYGYYAGDYNEVGTDNIYFSLLTYLFDILTQITLKSKEARLVYQRKTLYLQII